MFKDYDKYLSVSLKVYLFVLVIIFIMKLIGLDYFGLNLDYPIVNFIDNIYENFIIANIINFIFIMFYQHIMTSLIIGFKTYKLTFISIPFTFIFQFYLKAFLIKYGLNVVAEILYLLILCYVYIKITKNDKFKLKKFIIVILLNMFFQLISYATRYKYSLEYISSPSISIILAIDYTILMLMMYKIYFMKGDAKKWEFQDQVGSSLPNKINLLTLLRKLQKNLNNFKKQDKETKLTIIIYSILSLIWNVFTIFIVLLFAKLNNTFVECIFIITSFWLSKRSFGKAFHLSNMLHCFIVSNFSYYLLNRLTTPLGISIIVPIMLGVGLSYLTSKLVKKVYKPLYRGMSKDLFEETILKVVDKDSEKYKICYEYFIEKKSAVSLSMKYNYSEAGIKKIKDRINNKIKELN